MNEHLSMAYRRAKMTPPLPVGIRQINIRVTDDGETAISVTSTKAEVVFLSNDGTPTMSETLQRSRALTIGLIQHVVANHYDIDRIGMNSMRRTKDVILPRQVAMYFSKVMSSKSNGEVGRVFNRDPTTVWYGAEKIRRMIKKDEAFAAEIFDIKSKIEEKTR